jgi:hypothetical protein
MKTLKFFDNIIELLIAASAGTFLAIALYEINDFILNGETCDLLSLLC